MKSLTIFVFACLCFNLLITCTKKQSLLRKSEDINFEAGLNAILGFRALGELQGGNTTTNTSDDSEDIKELADYRGNCFMKMNNYFYNLYNIASKDTDMIITSKDGKTVNFNLCYDVSTTCANKKGLVAKKDDCIKFADERSNDKLWNLTRNYIIFNFIIIAENNLTAQRLTLVLPTGDKCSEGGNNTVIVDILCDPAQEVTKVLNAEEFDTQSCNNTVKMVTKYACKTTKFQAWFKRFGVNKLIVGSVLGLIGLFLLFFGNTYFKVCSSIIIAVCSGLMLKSLLAPFVTIDMFVSIGLGVLIALIVYNLMDLMISVLAAIIGYFLGNIAYNFVATWFTGINPQTLYYIVIVTSIVIVLIFAYLIKALIIIVATTLIGSYVAIRGLSICLGGFPDETYTSQLILNMEFSQLSRTFGGTARIYLMSILALFVVGLLIHGALSCCFDDAKGKEEKNKEHEKKDEEHEKLVNKEDK